MQTQIVLRGFIALPRRADEPFDRVRITFFHAPASLITQTKIALRGREFLLGGGAIPIHRQLEILRHDLAGFVKTPRLNCAAG